MAAFAGMTTTSMFDADLFDHPGSDSFPDYGEIFTLICNKPFVFVIAGRGDEMTKAQTCEPAGCFIPFSFIR